MRVTSFRFFQLHLCLFLQHSDICYIALYAGYDVKYVCGTHHVIKFCANFVLQATNVQGLGVRLVQLHLIGYASGHPVMQLDVQLHNWDSVA